jgi:hypothetical protein
MLERDRYPAGVPCWVETRQPDPDAAVAFYGGLFGWKFEEESVPGSPESTLIATLRGRPVAGVGSQTEWAPSTPGWITSIAVDDADRTARAASELGCRVVAEPFDVSEAGRMGVCSDPSGAKFGLWQAGKRAGAALVNEPGTWNFSELNTPDPDGAKTFYGAVFGWELSELGEGSGFFRMPGYGAFLAERDPDVRKRQADVGAPEGFEDAVAWLVPATAETPADAKPPHWSVTFAVDDADAIADRAVELGGTVLVPPVDAPWVRMTVVADPQGAMFTASKFTPP